MFNTERLRNPQDSFSTPLSFARKVKDRITRPRVNKQPIDFSLNYLRRFFPDLESNSHYHLEHLTTRGQRADAFRHDYIEIANEMVCGMTESTYFFELDPASFESKGSGYQEDMQLMWANFAQELAAKGLEASRANIEHITFQTIYKNLIDIALQKETDPNFNQVVLATSPPGDFVDGYHGVDSKHNWNKKETHHSFFYLFEVVGIENGKVKIKTTQLRTWHNMAQLLELHSRLGQPIESPTKKDIANQFIANFMVFDGDQIDQIKEALYVGSENWGVSPEEVPNLKDETFDHEQQFWQFYNQVFEQFFLNPTLDLLDSISSEQLNDEKFRQTIIKKIDMRSEIFNRVLQKKMVYLNTNPLYEQRYIKDLILAGLKNPLGIPQIINDLLTIKKEVKTIEAIDKAKVVYNLQEKSKIYGEKLSSDEVQLLKNSASGLLSVGNFAFGSAQCYTVGAFTLPNSLMKLSTPGSNFLIGLEAELGSSSKEKAKAILDAILAEDYQEMDLTNQGANRIWMVPASYLTEPGCRVDDKGMICGPCITEDFPLGIPFDHPLELANPLGPLAMTKSEFNQFIMTLKEKALSDQINEQLEFEELNEVDQEKVKQLTHRLSKRIFKTSLSSLISGVSEHTDEAKTLPPEKIAQIKTIHDLERLVIEMETNEKDKAETGEKIIFGDFSQPLNKELALAA